MAEENGNKVVSLRVIAPAAKVEEPDATPAQIAAAKLRKIAELIENGDLTDTLGFAIMLSRKSGPIIHVTSQDSEFPGDINVDEALGMFERAKLCVLGIIGARMTFKIPGRS